MLLLEFAAHSAGLAAGLLAIITTAGLQLMAPVALNEGLGVAASLRRSFVLSRRGTWAVLQLVVLTSLLSALVVALPNMAVAILRTQLVAPPILIDGAAVLQQATEALVLPFQLTVLTL